MASIFPATGLDSLVDPATSSKTNSPSHAGQHTNANDAIMAIQTKVGIDGSTDTSTLDYKIRHIAGNPGAVVDAFGADPTGVSASDSAFAAAYASLGGDAGQGEVILGIGVYKLTSFVCKSPNIGMTGPGSAACIISSHATGATIRAYNPSFNPASAFSNSFVAGRWGGFTVDGTNAGTSASGLHYGDLMGGRFDDIVIQKFTGASAIGLWMDNIVGWTERMTWTGIQVINCTKCIVFDVNSGSGTGPGFSSFGYNDFGMVKLAPFVNQDGWVVRNGCLLNGSQVAMMANCAVSVTGGNSGALIRVTGSSTSGGGLSYSSMFGVKIFVGAETDWNGVGGTTPHQTINVDNNVLNQVALEGTLGFYNTWTPSNVAKAGSAASFSFSGFSYGDATLSDNGSFASFVTIGGSAKTLGAYPVGAGELFISTGDVFDFGSLFQNATISLSGTPTMPREIHIYANQPSSGGPFTITWPSSSVIAWPGGTPPTMSTAANARDLYIIRTSSAGINPWVGQAIQNTH